MCLNLQLCDGRRLCATRPEFEDSIALEPMTPKLIVSATGYVVQADIRAPDLDSLVAEHIR
jgi:hypothetical protein